MYLKTEKIFQKNKDYYHHEGIRNNMFKSKNDSESKSKSKKNYYLTSLKYETIIKNILELYKKGQLEAYIPSLLKGWDIYSLGITFAKIIIKCNINNLELNNVVFKMIDLNFEKRINVSQILKIKKYINDFNINHSSSISSIKLNY
jgi:hypothetical protein